MAGNNCLKIRQNYNKSITLITIHRYKQEIKCFSCSSMSGDPVTPDKFQIVWLHRKIDSSLTFYLHCYGKLNISSVASML